ncbi:superinfection immunity protein [Acinetobacter sp.]|uniref:superinfection immunity protein n=1 Tax=Acinetobacter sp. TaxID=472 RepID=UPI00388E70CD
MIILKILVAILVYNIPIMIAFARRHPDILRIMIVNILFGWTVLGYGISFLWAIWPIAKEKRIA